MSEALTVSQVPPLGVHLQGSELSGWALGRYSYEGIDMNHNFADLNSVMWTAIELETDRSKLINHYFPIPEQYTSEDAFVRALGILSVSINTFLQYIFAACKIAPYFVVYS